MPRIKPSEWVPAGVETLEPNAMSSIKTVKSASVVASPGAGKTEFLAQKAAYLLQTGLCPDPLKILAVSFKREAARNLQSRIEDRCAPELASRFTSLTFDAFSKGLVDRFMTVIPERWRPTTDYRIVEPKTRDYLQSLNASRDAARGGAAEVAAIGTQRFESHTVGQVQLPLGDERPTTAVEFAVYRWFQENLRQSGGSSLTFPMINRLAELLLRSNEQILRGLRMTYPVVFLDEFQDITYGQYGLLCTAFLRAGATLTAVGDNKQRIMSWAGARPDAFVRFNEDFEAEERPLELNYRSSPALVAFQHVVAQAMDPDYVETSSRVASTISGDAVALWTMDRRAFEGPYLADWIKRDATRAGLEPRDYALIVRQKADEEEARLTDAFSAAGLGIRNEARRIGVLALQDLLAEDLIQVTLAVMRLATQQRAPDQWQLARDAMLSLRQMDPGRAGAARAERELEDMIRKLQTALPKLAPAAATVDKALDFVLSNLDLAAFAWAYPAYSVGDQLELARQSLYEFMQECAEGASSWTECLDRFEGIGMVPLMTIHRSKGLQYHTTFILGLDDDQWWAFANDRAEGMSAFFVALSRAKQRVIFTYAREQSRVKLAPIYRLIQHAGIQPTKID